MQHQPPSASKVFNESMRYINNAHEILKEKGEKENGSYHDKKYIRMACHTAYLGMLESLGTLMNLPKSKRMNILILRNYLSAENKKMLDELNNAYGVLHLYGGYDGLGKQEILSSGFNSAIKIINWVNNKLASTRYKI